MRGLILLLLVLAGQAAFADEPKLPELSLTYRVTWNGIGLGDASITLKPEGGANCYRYESQTHPVGLVRMFYGKPHEVSNFCVSDGKVVPKRFEYVRSRSDSFSLEFDAASGKVRDGNGAEREIPPNAQDRFGMHQAVRLWVLSRLKEKDPGAEQFKVAQVDDKRVREYTMAITGRESIEIDAGRFDCILVQRVDDPSKSSKFWIAPARDYMPVMVEQLRGGKADLRMELRR